MMSELSVIEYTDPCCSWAWGTEPKLRRLRWQYGDVLQWRTCLGGLIRDASQNWDGLTVPEAASKLSRYWSRVTDVTGMPYPVCLRWPPLTSDTMGQAVCAARMQSIELSEALLRRLREGVFVLGVPGDSWERVLDLAVSVPGLDVEQFAADLLSPEAEALYELDWQETRRPNRHVRDLTGEQMGLGDAKKDGDLWRYAFPTLVFRGVDVEATVPGWMEWEDYLAAMEAALPGCTADPVPLPTPDQALAEFGVLTVPELAALTSTDVVPVDSRIFDWGDGVMYVSDEVLAGWELAGWCPEQVRSISGSVQ